MAAVSNVASRFLHYIEQANVENDDKQVNAIYEFVVDLMGKHGGKNLLSKDERHMIVTKLQALRLRVLQLQFSWSFSLPKLEEHHQQEEEEEEEEDQDQNQESCLVAPIIPRNEE